MSSTQLVHLFGLKGNIRNNVEYLDENVTLYPCGNLIVIYNAETKTQKFINPSENGEKITSVALTNSKRIVAVGETEKGDRGGSVISLYDVNSQKKKKAINCFQGGHQQNGGYGGNGDLNSTEILDLNFSHDNKLLLAQGSAPDWVLTCWSWEKAKLVCSVKIPNPHGAAIYQSSFNPHDSSVCCVTGNGILRIFRIQDGAFKPVSIPTLKKEPQNYLSHTWLSEQRLLVSTDTGDLLFFENLEFRCAIPYEQANEFLPIGSVLGYSKGFVCGGANGVLRVFEASEETREFYKHTKTFQVEGELNQRAMITSLSISPSEDNLACTLSNYQTFVLGLSNTDILKAEEVKFELLTTQVHGPGQGGSAQITGMDVCLRKPLVVTTGLDKSVRIWNYVEKGIDLMKYFPEEAYSTSFHPSGLFVLVGFADKLRLMNLLMDDIRLFKEFPIKACRECRFSNGGQYFAAVNGNAVQVFRTYTFECVATMRAHVGKVRSLAWSHDDHRLVSTGMDGAVYRWMVRDGSKDAEYVAKGCKFSCAIANGDTSSVQVVGTDSVFRELEFPSGNTRLDITYPVSFNSLAVTRNGRSYFAGGAGGDSSGSVFAIKVPLTSELEVTEMPCHSSAVTRMCISPDDQFLFTASEDGTMAIFQVKDTTTTKKREKESSLMFAEEILVTKSDLEEKTDIMRELKNKVDELTLHNEYQLRLKDMNYNERIKEATSKFSEEIEADRIQYQKLGEDKARMIKEYEKQIGSLDLKHRTELEELEASYQAKINTEIERYQQLVEQRDSLNRTSEEENALLVETHEKYLNELTEDYEKKITAEQEEREAINVERIELSRAFEDTRKEIEEDADIEVKELKEKYNAKLSAEREATLRLKGENGIMKKKFSSLQNDIEQQKDRIKSLMEKEMELYEKIKGLEKDIQGHKKEIKEREETIQDKEKRIYDLKKKNQELEKFKFVLDYKIKELKRQIEPRESVIADMRQQIKEMDLELEQYHKSNAALDLMIGELKLKIEGMQKEIDDQKEKLLIGELVGKKYRADLHACFQEVGDVKVLKNAVVGLYKKYIQEQTVSHGDEKSKEQAHIQKEYNRQREYLEKSVESLKRKLTKDMKTHQADNTRLMRESVDLTNEINNLRRELTVMQKHQRKQIGMSISNMVNLNLNSPASSVSQPPQRAPGSLTPGQREIQLQKQQLQQLTEQLRRLESS